MRILGIDYGRKRVGLALSDALGITAQPSGHFLNNKSLFDNLKKLIQENDVSEIVLGHPLTFKGTKSQMTEEVEAFSEKLKEHLQLPVTLCDERLTTAQSERLLIEGDVKRKKRKEVRDSMAAVLILTGYLQSRGSL